jgi:hypothetical protein
MQRGMRYFSDAAALKKESALLVMDFFLGGGFAWRRGLRLSSLGFHEADASAMYGDKSQS